MSQPHTDIALDRPRDAGRAARAISIIALVVAVAFFAWRGPLSMAGQRLWDYAVCTSSAQVWLRGGDPYDTAAVNENWRSQHPTLGVEDDIGWLRPIVPPTTLAVFAPFAAMPLVAGAYLYLLTTTALVGVAAIACAKWADLRGATTWRFFAAGVLLSVPATLGLYSGNPVLLAGPLLIIGLYLASRRERHWLGGVLMGVGAACKIQIGLPILLAWFVVGRARSAGVGVATLCLLVLIGGGRLSMAGVDWWGDWTRNVAEANGPGGLNDYATTYNGDDHLNLQVPLWAVTGERTQTMTLTAVLFAIPAAAFAAIALRGRLRVGRFDERLQLGALAVVAALLVLPVYHRTYDGIILLPAFAVGMAAIASDDRQIRRLGWVSLVLLAAMLPPPGLLTFLQRRGHLPAGLVGNGVYRSVIARYRPWAILALCCPLILLFQRRLGAVAAVLPRKKPAPAVSGP